MPASADPNGDDDDNDGFIDIDELLAAMKKESISTSVQPTSGGMAETDENGTRRGSPVGSTVGSTQGEHIVLSTLVRTSYSYDPRFDDPE